MPSIIWCHVPGFKVVGPYPQHRMEGLYHKDMSLPKASFDWFKKELNRAGELAQWLRALTALPEVLSSIPSNHMVAHSHL